jgi:hypothetical protein
MIGIGGIERFINFEELKLITNEKFSNAIKIELIDDGGKLIKLEDIPECTTVIIFNEKTVTIYTFYKDTKEIHWNVLSNIDAAYIYKAFKDLD